MGRDEAAERVAATFAALAVPELSLPLLADTLGWPLDTTRHVVAELTAAGGLVRTRPGWFAPAGHAQSSADPALRARFVTVLTTAATSADWVAEHRPHLSSAFRAVAQAGVSAAQCELALALWDLTAEPPLLHDAAWRGELGQWGEGAARQWGNRAALAVLHERSGRVAAAAGDVAVAESQLVRALLLWHETAEPAATGVLTALLDLFRRTGQWHRALDAAFELHGEQRRRGEPVGETLLAIGEVMLSADRPGAAARYLQRAELALGPAVDLLVSRAAAERGTGADAASRRHLHRALALAVDVDDVAAARIRALLRA
ncbi:hypothetical protein [Actinokineospora diospyrosa]|uniref:Uncharacterized protein n=1 Tax=Actinokineospora diospyrosa TaxID=103728 RepID=A0ABT1I5B0_9PSEU|nr:hypothetical protein [Actinokineospora diospyrosa]MCP2267813.1 hypothetical protein [Actinokineospora diospyrosa]